MSLLVLPPSGTVHLNTRGDTVETVSTRFGSWGGSQIWLFWPRGHCRADYTGSFGDGLDECAGYSFVCEGLPPLVLNLV